MALVWSGLVWWFRRDPLATPSGRAPFVLWMLGGAGLALFALGQDGEWPERLLATLALAGASIALIRVSVRRRNERAAISVGDSMPPFSALDEHGDTVESTSFAGAPLLLKFFRGHW